MTTLNVNTETGFGKVIDENGTEYSVVRTGDVWSLRVHRKDDKFGFWAKENVKRISTLQKHADLVGYGIKIEEETT